MIMDMKHRRIMLAVGFFFSLIGYISTKDCDDQKFLKCMEEVIELESGDFHIENEDQMKAACTVKAQAIQCGSNYIKNCSTEGKRNIYDLSIGGKLELVKEMCEEGSPINKGYLKNIDCWKNIRNEIDICTDKYNKSQTILSKSDMESRLKLFYGCCAFEWHRNCLAKVARRKCNEEAAEFVYKVSTILGGSLQQILCSTSYSSCHGLVMDEQETEDILENIPNGSTLHLNFKAIHLFILFFISINVI